MYVALRSLWMCAGSVLGATPHATMRHLAWAGAVRHDKAERPPQAHQRRHGGGPQCERSARGAKSGNTEKHLPPRRVSSAPARHPPPHQKLCAPRPGWRAPIKIMDGMETPRQAAHKTADVPAAHAAAAPPQSSAPPHKQRAEPLIPPTGCPQNSSPAPPGTRSCACRRRRRRRPPSQLLDLSRRRFTGSWQRAPASPARPGRC